MSQSDLQPMTSSTACGFCGLEWPVDGHGGPCRNCGLPQAALCPWAQAFCDHYIGDGWAGTYCKLLAGHDGPHVAHFPKRG